MATSKILYMKDCGTSFHGKHLKVALEYIVAREKTQDFRLVAGINCMPEKAYEQMKATKHKFNSIDGRQAYHLIISFVENEIDADTAFELTEKFVKEYLGDAYEAVYAVHDNTDNIHSHIVFNSVNRMTGKKFRYQKGDWGKYIQPIVNRLCEEYGLSTIEIETDRAKPQEFYKEWDEYKDGPFVWSNMIKRDIDICLVQAGSYEEFLSMLSEKGYEIKQGSITPPGTVPLKDASGNVVYGIPVHYAIAYKAEGAKEPEVTVIERTERKNVGFASMFAKLSFKKKSRQDIVKLVASGNLTPEQLQQIRIGMEKKLTENQLLNLINNNVPADQMKEIIEIAVLENSMQ